jgi:hypothetical protein
LVFIRQAKKDCIFDDRLDSTGLACIHLDTGHNSALRGTTFFTGLIYRYLSMLDSLPPPSQFISIVDELVAQPDPRTAARSRSRPEVSYLITHARCVCLERSDCGRTATDRATSLCEVSYGEGFQEFHIDFGSPFRSCLLMVLPRLT